LCSKYIRPGLRHFHPASFGIYILGLFKLTLFVGMATQEGIIPGKTSDPAQSDLAQLWQSAVEDYEKRTKKSLRLAQLSNIDQIKEGAEGLSNQFKYFRDDRAQ
jgi:hypothetical protein